MQRAHCRLMCQSQQHQICCAHPGLNFTYGVETLILYQSLKIPNLSHYKMMVLNLQRITENGNMILLQNEDWFLS